MTRILLVDDNPLILRVLLRLLRSAGVEIVVASGVLDAERTIMRSPTFDAILTDVDMPDGTGFDLAEWLALHPTAPRVLFMSGDTSPARFAEARRLGGVLYDKMDLHAVAEALRVSLSPTGVR